MATQKIIDTNMVINYYGPHLWRIYRNGNVLIRHPVVKNNNCFIDLECLVQISYGLRKSVV